MEHSGLRSGYLLIQNAKKKWKVRWFVLEEDQLCCYHKHKTGLISALPLANCVITSPCNDLPDTNWHGLFKLSLQEGEEIYFQSAGPEDRDAWAHAIGAVIRSVSNNAQDTQEKMPFQTFRAYANVSEIIGALQDPDAGIATATHLRSGEVYKNCFRGSEIVDWLLRWSLVRNRENGSAMAQTLMRLGHLQQVCLKDGSSVSPKFSDSEKLYRFTSINLGSKRNSFYDSTDSDSSSSDEDDDDAGEYAKPKKGRVLKQAFLAKKKVLRKGWRVVKVKLEESPRALLYCRGAFASCTDDKTYPQKMLPLEGCTVTELVKNKSNKAGPGAPSKYPSYRICFRTARGKTLTLQMKDEQEKREWLALIHTTQEQSTPAGTSQEQTTPVKTSQAPEAPARKKSQEQTTPSKKEQNARKKSKEQSTPVKSSKEQNAPDRSSQEEGAPSKSSQEENTPKKSSKEQDTPDGSSREEGAPSKEQNTPDRSSREEGSLVKSSKEQNAPDSAEVGKAQDSVVSADSEQSTPAVSSQVEMGV